MTWILLVVVTCNGFVWLNGMIMKLLTLKVSLRCFRRVLRPNQPLSFRRVYDKDLFSFTIHFLNYFAKFTAKTQQDAIIFQQQKKNGDTDRIARPWSLKAGMKRLGLYSSETFSNFF